ncbi:hypothetical protein BDR05DRAFT_978457 [Suillus weaverae]|nr:hypothetical protein BDR05DRAFT_978457 [Suillus weaverae]
MDDILFQYQVLQNEIEMEVIDDKESALIVAATVLVGTELTQQERINSPFITTMGFDVETFTFILTSGFAKHWYHTPIPRDDISQYANPCVECRSLDAGGALGLVSHYLSSTMHQISLQQVFALIPTTVSRYLSFGLHILLLTLRNMADAKIHWLQGDEFEECSALVVACHARLQGAFGSIDGLKIPVQTSNDIDIENAMFNGWLSEHFISSVLTFSSQGIVIAARTNTPGSWHDSHHTPAGYYIVADTAFPRGSNNIDGCICAPLKQGQTLRGTAADIEECMAFNHELFSYRQTAEWGMRGLQGAFGHLRVPLGTSDKEVRGDLIETCVHLHNLRAKRVGINQICTVYMNHWQATDEDIEIWHDFENMLFLEQRQKDWVTRFHVILEYQ